MNFDIKKSISVVASALILIVIYMLGCATAPKYVTEYRDVVPPFDYKFIKTVGVVEFSNSSERSGAGKIIADRIEQLLLKETL